ncbi:MAG: oxygenase MpaB family protein [Acidimicrobiales bacterium]
MAPARPLTPLRRAVGASVSSTFDDSGRERRLGSFFAPAGDPGWFGPDSIAWAVHGELGPMLIGGLSSLMLQTLHPLVMQGVADHSGYRKDPFGRFRRTADFLAATTYGSDEMAWRAVHEVRRIHARVSGVAFDGRPYSAADPDLLTYVHVTEVWSFLRAFQRYSGRPLLLSEKNRYLSEVAVVARRLGALEVPQTTEQMRSYLRAARGELVATPAAKEAIAFLRRPVGRSIPERAAHLVVIEGAIDLLPSFARRRLGVIRPGLYRRAGVRPAGAAVSVALHVLLGESPLLAAARHRATAGR